MIRTWWTYKPKRENKDFNFPAIRIRQTNSLHKGENESKLPKLKGFQLDPKDAKKLPHKYLPPIILSIALIFN